jgi:hypothetical protein
VLRAALRVFAFCVIENNMDIIDINPAVFLEVLESLAYVPKYALMDLKLERWQ